jgi:hypothetical protein
MLPAAVLLGCLALGGAAMPQKMDIDTEIDKKADFSTIRTYAVLPPAPMLTDFAPNAPRNPTLTQEALAPPIEAAIERELTRRGLVKAAPEAADVHVVYTMALQSQVSSSYLGEHYGYITGWGSPVAPGLAPSTSVRGYQKGTIVVDVVQAKAKRGIWRGLVNAKIEAVRSLEDRIKRIDDGVRRMFERFPIKPRG